MKTTRPNLRRQSASHVSELARGILRDLSWEGVLRRILEAGIELSGADAAVLHIFNKEKGLLGTPKRQNVAPALAGSIAGLEGIAGASFRRTETAAVSDIAKDHRFHW